jgi:acylphosphatase
VQKYLKFEAIVMFMKRIHAFISGEVQGVGYREDIKRIAFDSGVFGWVMNLEDGRVEIIAEGEDRSVEQFLDRINIRKYPVFVVSIEVEEERYRGEFSSFKVLRDKDVQKELLSALSRGTVEIHEMKEILQAVRQDTSHIPEIRANTKMMLEKQDKMLEKQDMMLEKQDKMLEKQDMMLEKQDLHIEITRNGFNDVKNEIKDVKNEIHLQRDDFKEVFLREVNELHIEINEIKATLGRMQAA